MITKIVLPDVGDSLKAAKHLVMQVRMKQEAVESEFNGTPMTAYLEDTPQMVLMRWHYDRMLIQIANGVLDVRTVADQRYVR